MSSKITVEFVIEIFFFFFEVKHMVIDTLSFFFVVYITGRTSSGAATRAIAKLDLSMLGRTSCFASCSY